MAETCRCSACRCHISSHPSQDTALSFEDVVAKPILVERIDLVSRPTLVFLSKVACYREIFQTHIELFSIQIREEFKRGLTEAYIGVLDDEVISCLSNEVKRVKHTLAAIVRILDHQPWVWPIRAILR